MTLLPSCLITIVKRLLNRQDKEIPPAKWDFALDRLPIEVIKVVDYLALGNRIRTVRKSKDWKIKDLANHSGISEDYLGKIERGTGVASLETIVDIANALDVGLDCLVGKDVNAAVDYLNTDINKALATMDEKKRKRFLAFVLHSSIFFNDYDD